MSTTMSDKELRDAMTAVEAELRARADKEEPASADAHNAGRCRYCCFSDTAHAIEKARGLLRSPIPSTGEGGE